MRKEKKDSTEYLRNQQSPEIKVNIIQANGKKIEGEIIWRRNPSDQ